MNSRVPYSQQFTPDQTPLNRLLPILRQASSDVSRLKTALAAAFFKETASPAKLAGNTIIALKTYGILDDKGNLSDFGKELIACQGNESAAYPLIAKRILFKLDGIGIVETLREMEKAGERAHLKTLPIELGKRGIKASQNSSDLSGVLNWLRQAHVLNGYNVDESVYGDLIGTKVLMLEILKTMERGEIAFLRAMVALNVNDWVPYNTICLHAEDLYPGEIRYNWKDVVGKILYPLQKAGLIEIRKKVKQSKSTPAGRGGKVTDVRPTKKFENEVCIPLLEPMYKSAGFSKIREILSLSMVDLVDKIRRTGDTHERGKALEHFTVRLCQLLDLEFMGWRETDIAIAGGGEIDAMFHSARLIYSRWQIQCKVGPISLEAVAKEVGMQEVSLANVILVVGTEKATESAITYRNKVISKSNLNIILIDGLTLDRVIVNSSEIFSVLKEQASNALKLKPVPLGIKEWTDLS